MLKVYLAGEIHSNWREEIIQLCEKEKLKIEFSSPVTDHEASDNCGVEILGAEEKNFWKDRKGANINSIRTKKSIQDCDVIIVGGGPAGSAAALYAKKFGLKSVVLDKSFFPRDKVCGDALSGKCIRIMRELDLLKDVEKQRFLKKRKTKVYLKSLQQISLPKFLSLPLLQIQIIY